MAEGGRDDLVIGTEYDHQAGKMPQMERRGFGGFNLGGMVSGAFQAVARVPKAVAQVPKAVYHGLGHVGKELKEAHLGGGKKPLQPFNFNEDFKPDFVSTCEAVGERLFDLDSTYGILDTCEIGQMLETLRQLKEKQILISVVGHLNAGKSTLLNALLGAKLLPMKKEATTSVKVHIHHVQEDSHLATSDQHPKLLLETGNQVHPEEVVGAKEIYKRLETLNDEVRNSAEPQPSTSSVGIPTPPSTKQTMQPKGYICTIETSVPLLASTSSNWQVVLVDTPGTGDFNSRVAVAAEGAVKCSSAYLLVTTYDALQNAENVEFIRNLHEYDQGVLTDRRLIVVVTKFDQTNRPFDPDQISVETVHKKVCELVSKACPDVTISREDVLPLSGLLAYEARMLMSHPDGPEHDNYKSSVKWSLNCHQSLPGGQGESQSSCLEGRSDDELAKQLLDVSKFGSLEARIHIVTKSCIKVWVSKMKNDYDRYLAAAKGQLWRQCVSLREQMIGQRKERLQIQECLRTIDDQRHMLKENMMSKVYEELKEKYPEDLKVWSDYIPSSMPVQYLSA